MANRGMINEELRNKYKDITQTELRLIPFFQYCVVNYQRIEPCKISEEEREILKRWRDEGKISFSCSNPSSCTKEFWDYMHEVMWYGGYACRLGEEVNG